MELLIPNATVMSECKYRCIFLYFSNQYVYLHKVGRKQIQRQERDVLYYNLYLIIYRHLNFILIPFKERRTMANVSLKSSVLSIDSIVKLRIKFDNKIFSSIIAYFCPEINGKRTLNVHINCEKLRVSGSSLYSFFEPTKDSNFKSLSSR